MRKVVLYMTMTLDGFFNLDWMGEHPSTKDEELNNDSITAMSKTDSVALVGYRFFSEMVPYWLSVENNPASSASERAIAHSVNNSRYIVISSKAEELAGKHAELLVAKGDASLVAAITRLKQHPGGDLAVIGGVRTAQTFVRLGLIDEYHLLVYPVVAGQGARVFTEQINLKLISTKTYPSGVIRGRYQPA